MNPEMTYLTLLNLYNPKCSCFASIGSQPDIFETVQAYNECNLILKVALIPNQSGMNLICLMA